MSWTLFRRAAAACLAVTLAAPAHADTALSGPFVHENLAVYFVHGESAPGPTPWTLQQALKNGFVTVRETGDVNRLTIENTGHRDVFVQSGDLLRGGRQDRVMEASLILAAHSGPVSVDVFCVESGRWAPRGDEDAHQFASSEASLPTLAARRALNGVSGDEGARQSAVWSNVAENQTKLSETVGASVADSRSPTSLQLTLENDALAQAQHAYLAALESEGRRGEDILGHVVAVNGRLVSADIYPSNGLFRRMWEKNLRASATEAIGAFEAAGAVSEPPSVEATLAFLEGGASAELREAAAGRARVRAGDNGLADVFESETEDGRWVHRTYLAN